MKPFAFIGTIALLLLMIYNGCSLIKEDSKDDPFTDITTSKPTGFWIESGESPREIIEISDNLATIHTFHKDAKIIQKLERGCVINTEKSEITLTKPDQSNEITKYTLTDNALQLTKNGSSKSYIRYSGPIPSDKWDAIPFQMGKEENKIPQGAWRSATTEEDQLILISNGTITIITYKPIESALYYEHIPFMINSTNDSIILNFKDGERQAVPYRFINGKLEVNPEGEYIVFSPFTEQFTPQGWNITSVKLNTHEDTPLPNISGTWVEKGNLRGMQISGTTLNMHSYQPSDSSIFDSTFSYYLDKDSLYLSTGTIKKGYKYSFTGDSLYLYFSGGSWIFSSSQATFPLSHWTPKSGTVAPITGSWITDNTDKNEIIELGTTSYKKWIYIPQDSMIKESNLTYTLNATGDSIFLSNGGAQIDKGVVTRGINKLSFTMSDGITRYYSRHLGKIPLDHWVIKNGLANPIPGKWLVKDGSSNRIVFIHNDTLDHFLYNAADSTFSKDTYICVIDTANDSIFLKKDGIIVDRGRIELNLGDLFIQLGMWTKTFVKYDGAIPHVDWKLKSGVKPSFLGTWLINDGSKSTIMVFMKDTLVAVNYSAATETFKRDTLTYTYNATTDSMHLFSMGLHTGEGTITVGNGMITIKKSDNTTTIYTKYDGSIPHPDWKLKVDLPNPFPGTKWISAGINPGEILTFSPDSLIFWTYDFVDSQISKGSITYKVTKNPDSLHLILLDEIISAKFSFSGDTLILSDSEGDSKYVKYNGTTPYSGWVERKRTAADYEGTWVEEIDSNKVVTFASGKAIIYTYFDFTNVIDTAYYQTRFNFGLDSLYLIDDYGNIENSYKINLSQGVLGITDLYTHTTYRVYRGTIPLDQWKFTLYSPMRSSTREPVGILRK